MGGHGEPFRRGRSCCHCLYRLVCCRCCRSEEMNVERKVWLDGRSEPSNTISNAVNNQKYNLLNFVPLVLFNQFKLFFNFFQLAINLSQLVPILKVGTPLPTKASSSPTYRR
jgi:phospholipid-translocating ATPase